MLTLYDSRLSGNGWKVRLLLSFLRKPYQRRVLNLAEGATRTPEFLELNPLARVPVLVLDDGSPIIESDAILVHLARGTPWLPDDALAATRVLQWLFFEQYDHLKYLARPRFVVSIARTADQFADELAYLRPFGRKALQALNDQLQRTPFLTGDSCTIADIALYPYTSMAEMGGYDLGALPAVQRWLQRFSDQPDFVPLIPQ
ncbi:MAG TPA: glutathione S-transferase family protein [Burkholderiaceae bacterium]|nr:glutathione S-transferase family protein [Burkholderiaceae bacterium]